MGKPFQSDQIHGVLIDPRWKSSRRISGCHEALSDPPRRHMNLRERVIHHAHLNTPAGKAAAAAAAAALIEKKKGASQW